MEYSKGIDGLQNREVIEGVKKREEKGREGLEKERERDRERERERQRET
jgi:hypothetical protein